MRSAGPFPAGTAFGAVAQGHMTGICMQPGEIDYGHYEAKVQ